LEAISAEIMANTLKITTSILPLSQVQDKACIK
jgi:hypothetical protein